MRLMRVVLMILAVLSLAFAPVAAAAHDHHDGLHGIAASHVDAALADLGHDSADRADGMPCAHHHDAGKCCGLPCCCSPFFACGVAAPLTVPLPLVRARTLVIDDRPRASVATGLPQEPPIAG